MPPNTIELPIAESGMVNNGTKPGVYQPPPKIVHKENYWLKIFQTLLNFIAQTLIVIVAGICMYYSFIGGTPLTPTLMHILLCVLGYQVVMAHGILSLTNENSWSSPLKFVDKRRAHWILQICASVLVIVGSFHKILIKEVHWDSTHSKFGLVAMVFSVASLFNGLTSLFAFELRRFLPGNISKVTHILFGTVAFVAANICLIFGMLHPMFRFWATEPFTDTLIAFTVISTFIIIFNPIITCIKRSESFFKK